MRIILLSLLVFCSLLLVAQAYEPVFLNGPVHFKSQSGYMIPYRIDSIVHHGDTTDYYSFKMIRPLGDGYQDLFTLKGGSWIGKKIERRPNGEWRFYNCIDKPLILMQNAIDEQSWVFYLCDDGSYFQARVFEVNQRMVLGQLDSVKQICLQYYDSDGNATDHPFNSDTLELSKNHGLVSVFDFYYFPYSGYDFFDYTASYINGKLILAGIEELDLEYRNITAMDVFTYNIDDELHLNQVNNGFCDQFINYKTIRKIIQRDISSSAILNYQAEYCTRKTNYYFTSGIETIDTFHFINNISYNLNNFAFINKLSFEPFSENNEYFSFLIAQGNFKMENGGVVFHHIDADIVDYMMIDGYSIFYYYKGFGGPFIHTETFEGCCFNDNIIYYKISGIEFGTPYNCSQLLPVEQSNNSKISISPNPVVDVLYVSGNESISAILIYDQMGKLLIEKTDIPDFGTDISFLPAGLYLLQINTRNGVVMKKFVKM